MYTCIYVYVYMCIYVYIYVCVWVFQKIFITSLWRKSCKYFSVLLSIYIYIYINKQWSQKVLRIVSTSYQTSGSLLIRELKCSTGSVFIFPAVLYEIYRPDNKPLSLMLPVSASVQDVVSAVVQPGGDHVLIKMNSTGGGNSWSNNKNCENNTRKRTKKRWEITLLHRPSPDLVVCCSWSVCCFKKLVCEPHAERAQLKLDATAVYTALGINERLFICTSSQVEQLVRNHMVIKV